MYIYVHNTVLLDLVDLASPSLPVRVHKAGMPRHTAHSHAALEQWVDNSACSSNGLTVHVTHPLDDLSTPALKRSCAVHRYTDTRMRGPCPEGAASTVDFYIIF